MVMDIVLIRHGMTPGNELGRYIGAQTDESLSDKGVAELLMHKHVYDKFIQDRVVRYYTSPMKRCIKSMEVLFPKAEYKRIDGLLEIDFGLFENQNYHELSECSQYQQWIDSNGEMDFPNGEGRQHFIDRSVQAFEKIVHDMNDNRCDRGIVVCHGGSIMAILSTITGNGYYDFQVKNAHGYIVRLQVEDGMIRSDICNDSEGGDYALVSYNSI